MRWIWEGYHLKNETLKQLNLAILTFMEKVLINFHRWFLRENGERTVRKRLENGGKTVRKRWENGENVSQFMNVKFVMRNKDENNNFVSERFNFERHSKICKRNEILSCSRCFNFRYFYVFWFTVSLVVGRNHNDTQKSLNDHTLALDYALMHNAQKHSDTKLNCILFLFVLYLV